MGYPHYTIPPFYKARGFQVFCLILILLTVLFFIFKPHGRLKCSMFKTQIDAQKHYAPYLDKNNDGKACNDLL